MVKLDKSRMLLFLPDKDLNLAIPLLQVNTNPCLSVYLDFLLFDIFLFVDFIEDFDSFVYMHTTRIVHSQDHRQKLVHPYPISKNLTILTSFGQT